MRCSVAVLVFCLVLGAGTLAGLGDSPNIVIVLADDLGFGDPGCYNDESKIPTPSIDQLARQGCRLLDAHSPSSVCTPTRYGLLTGRYCWRTPLKRSVLWPWDPPLIESDRLTMGAMLQSKGYQTACIGKWHLGWQWPIDEDAYVTDEFPGHTIPQKRRVDFGQRINFGRRIQRGPTEYGFDYYFGDDVPNFPPYVFIEDDRTVGLPTVSKPKGMFGHAGPALPAWDLSLVMPTLTQRAVQWIEKQAKTPDQPFFLYMPLTAPHTPIAPSAHFIGKSQAGWYGDYVHQVDWTVGQVLAALERTGAAENTLVIFTSDNGSPQRVGTEMAGGTGTVKKLGHDPSRPWRGMKSDIWEGGHRVPFVMRWPQHVAPDTVCEEPLILTDLMRTVASIVEYELPESSAEDSFDLGPALFSQPATVGSDAKSPIRDHLIHHSGNGLYAIRVGHWKFIEGRKSGGFTRYQPPADAPAGQLYHLGDDPQEQNNLYIHRPEVVAQLGERLTQIRTADRSYPVD